jgi:NTP pyrophosphatase (non-canonical NTP hydrolase)
MQCGLVSCCLRMNIQNLFKPLARISARHYKWLKAMGWVGVTTPLEQLMLIVSECGEAANECRGKEPTAQFKLELADIILRTLGLAERYNIDMDAAIKEKMELNQKKGKKDGRLK